MSRPSGRRGLAALRGRFPGSVQGLGFRVLSSKDLGLRALTS